MIRAVIFVPLAGCYIGAHGSADAPVHHSGSGLATAPQAHLDLGLGGVDETQGFAFLASVGSSPLVSNRDDPDAPRRAIFSMGGRYERAFTPARPSVRGFGRVLLGGNLCSGEDSSMEEPDTSCDMPEEQRSVGVVSLALGVALTGVAEKKEDELTPGFGTLGLAVVYTHASDEALGSADFLGIELSGGFGGDILTPFMRRDD